MAGPGTVRHASHAVGRFVPSHLQVCVRPGPGPAQNLTLTLVLTLTRPEPNASPDPDPETLALNTDNRWCSMIDTVRHCSPLLMTPSTCRHLAPPPVSGAVLRQGADEARCREVSTQATRSREAYLAIAELVCLATR